MDHDKSRRPQEMLTSYPNIQRLVSAPPEQLTKLDPKLYAQSIINLLVQAGKIASAGGHKDSMEDPLSSAKPELMLSEIEKLLTDILVLVNHAEFFMRGKTKS
jgi:hypothetical protein